MKVFHIRLAAVLLMAACAAISTVPVVHGLRTANTGAARNALVETDVASLREHLILLMRQKGLAQDLPLPIWTLRKVLLSADQLCLSRMQVRVLLSVVVPNDDD